LENSLQDGIEEIRRELGFPRVWDMDYISSQGCK